MKDLSVIILMLLFSSGSLTVAEGQDITPAPVPEPAPERDKYLLLTMPYNQRPLTLYMGQLQVNTGYKFAVRAQSYNADGDIVFLRTNGTGSVYHYYFINLRYGILNFIEFGAETNFLRRGIREPAVTVLSKSVSSVDSITVTKLTESKGMGDIFVYTIIRLPIEYKWLDFNITGGIFLPSAKYEPQKPANTITSASLTSANTYNINLHYYNTNGYGIPVYLVAAATKFGFKDFTGEVRWTMRTPMKEGHNIRWEETLTEKVFSYNDNSYSYLLSDAFMFDAAIHYQATGWFNIHLNGSFFRTRGGWTEYWGNKYENPEKKLVNIEPGFELQISPGLKVYQVAGFPVTGRNNDAPFYLFTTVSYNLFPFLR